MRSIKKVIAMMLSVCMMITVVPLDVFAEPDVESTTCTSEDGQHSYGDSVLNDEGTKLISTCIVCGAISEEDYVPEPINPVGAEERTVPVAKIGEVTYNDLHEALEVAKNGGSVELLTDVTLEGNWSPIDNFKGIFDGKDFTITNLTVSASTDCAALIGVLDGGTVKNVKFTSVSIVSNASDVGVAVGRIINNGTVSGVTVISGSTTGEKRVGGIVGSIKAYGKIENCSNAATIMANTYNAGGIVGAAYYTVINQEMYVTGCTNSGDITSAGNCAGGIVGLSAANISGNVNTGSVAASGTGVGGVIGEQKSYGSVINNTNSGNVTNTNLGNYGNGGIIGWLRYHGSTEVSSYEVSEIISVTRNSNSGNVSGGNDAGGIIGAVYNSAVVTGNKNTAISLTGTTFAAGIVGNYQINETPANAEPASNKMTIYGNTISAATTISAGCKDPVIYTNDNAIITSNESSEHEPNEIVVTPETAQSAIDQAKDGDIIVMTGGNYDTLYIRNNGSDVNRIIKDVTIRAAEGATVNIAQIAGQNNNDKNLDVENLTIDGLNFNVVNKTGVFFNTNGSGTLRVNGLTVQNCSKTGDNVEHKGNGYDYGAFVGLFYDSATALNDKFAGDENLTRGYHNIKILNNRVTSIYQPIKFPNVGPLYGLTVTGNTFTSCKDNNLMLSTRTTGAVVISDNTFDKIDGRAMRIANVDGNTQFTIENNSITYPVGYDTGGDGSVAKITGTSGFSISESNNQWIAGSLDEANTTWIAMGKDYVAQIGNDKYASLQKALDAAQFGTITLLADCVADEVIITAGKDITLDLAGYTITTSSSSVEEPIIVANGSTLTINDSSTGKTGKIDSNESMLAIKMTSKETYVANKTAVLVVNGGTIIGCNYGISGNGTRHNTSITINGGRVSSSDGPAIYHPQAGTLTVTGGTITGKDSAIAIKAGILTVSGGELIATGEDTTPTEGYSNGVNASGAAIQIESNKGYAGNPDATNASTSNNRVEVNIEGGTITSQNGVTIYEYLDSSTTKTSVSKMNITGGTFECGAGTKVFMFSEEFSTSGVGKKFISGGKFGSDPTSDYLKSGYETKKNGNYYEVGEHKLVSVAKVAPNCGSKGVAAHYKCTFCGKLYSDAAGNTEVTAASLVIPATGNHSYGAWQVSSKPTCTTAGSNKSVCSVCGHERYSPIAATGHSYGSDGRCTACGDYDATKVVVTPPAASTTTPTTPTTPAPAKPATTPETAETTPAPVENAKPETADTTITKVEASEEVIEAVKETVKVEEGTAKVETETIEKVIEATEEGKEVVLPLTQVTEEAVNKAEVSADALEKVAEKEADVVIQLTDVTVKLDAVAIAAVAEQAQGKNIEIRAVKTETVTLTEKQQDALADKETAIVVTAQIFADGEYIGDFKGGTATIMLPFTPEEGRAAEDYKVYFVDDDGSLTPVAAEYVDGHMVFTTGHFSDYAIVYEKAEAVEDSESDTEVVITPEEASEGTSLPIIPIVVVIAIIVIGGIVLVMRRKKEE